MRRAALSGIVILVLAASIPAGAATEVVQITIADVIQPASQSIVERGLSEADAMGAELLVLQLDTPGGSFETTRQLILAMMAAQTPVAVFVGPSGSRATSVGFQLLMAADVAAMSPEANISADLSAQLIVLPEELAEKIIIEAATMTGVLAEDRGRNGKLAAQALKEGLYFSAESAFEEGLIEFIALTVEDLVQQLDGREITRPDGRVDRLELEGWQLVRIEPTTMDHVRSYLADPLVILALLVLVCIGTFVLVCVGIFIAILRARRRGRQM